MGQWACPATAERTLLDSSFAKRSRALGGRFAAPSMYSVKAPESRPTHAASMMMSGVEALDDVKYSVVVEPDSERSQRGGTAGWVVGGCVADCRVAAVSQPRQYRCRACRSVGCQHDVPRKNRVRFGADTSEAAAGRSHRVQRRTRRPPGDARRGDACIFVSVVAARRSGGGHCGRVISARYAEFNKLCACTRSASHQLRVSGRRRASSRCFADTPAASATQPRGSPGAFRARRAAVCTDLSLTVTTIAPDTDWL